MSDTGDDLTIGQLLDWAGYPDTHQTITCTDPDCPGCMFCAGGLWGCQVCGGLEGGMPTQCPGRAMTPAEVDDVYAGRRDYRLGTWTAVPSVHCPAGRDQTESIYEAWLHAHPSQSDTTGGNP